MTATDECDEFLVVGGGIGGLAAALALARDGRQVRVLERAEEFAELGAGLQLAPNATRLLREWGLLDELRELGHEPRRLVLADAETGRELTALDLTGTFVERYGAPYVLAHRGDLLQLLVQACRRAGVELEPAREVTSATATADAVTVKCADGTTYQARAVIAADGLRSRLRSLLHDDEPIFSGYVAYRGTLPVDEAVYRADLGDVVAFIGPGLHFVQYAVRRGSLYNQVAVFRSRRYQRGEANWGHPTELDEAFAATCPHVRGATAALWRHQWWPMYDREPVNTWVWRDRIALLGDAAHPMLQYLAQGACQALEDAYALAAAVRRHVPTGRLNARSPVGAAFADYQAARVARATRVQRNARIWGDIWHTDGLARALRDEAFLRREPKDYTATDWLYGQSPEQQESSPALARNVAAQVAGGMSR